MRYHGLPLRPMQESGAFLLRAMQNEEMPRLDLLVRESVQNALDAALDRRSGGEVRIGFHLREHATETITSLLSEGIDRKVLMARHPKGGQLLEIRDSLTEGLTGPLCFEDIGPDGVHGNLLKLVYEIGRTRSDIGAGGSWGLGKTCYFRMGLGLVFYYSRIKLDDGYQERLVASLVEDETRSDRLQRETRTGIGWWGAEAGLRPITRATEIHRALDMLRVQHFTGTETGTSIIIPFLRDDLVPGAHADEEGAVLGRPWWYETYDAYVAIALERWFCARLDNRHFATGPRLTASVNGKIITSGKMLPVFQATQALYNRAIGVPIDGGDYLTRAGVDADAVMQHLVAPRNLFKPSGPAGDVAAALLTPEQLGMGAPLNHFDPGLCVFGISDATPPYRPLVTFMRKPGMCVCWDDSTESRGWAGGAPERVDSRYLVAVFVPKQDRVLADAGRGIRSDSQVTLESYLRGCERADHAAWYDAAGLKIIEKIRANCGRILRDFGSKRTVAPVAAPSIRLARNLAGLLLPERGMGTDGVPGLPSPPPKVPGQGGAGDGGTGRVGGGESGGAGGRRRRSMPAAPVLELLDVAYSERGIAVRWCLRWGSADRGLPRKISLNVDSESGPITLQNWGEDGLGAFPFLLDGLEIDSKSKGASGACAEATRDCSGDILVRAVGDGVIDEVRGLLRIVIVGGGAGMLRPVLVAGLVHIDAENP